jgi:hypothetical protein|tara:strand:- start:269 stop:478 length:210 start_codon:yes stop_codon:yes gene_type:complete
MSDIERRNELELVEIRGELRLLSEKIDVLKNNDIHHIQKSIDTFNKVLWAVGLLIIAQLAVGIRLAVFS